MSMEWPAALVIVPVGIISMLSGLIANLIQLQINTFLQLPTSQYHPRGKIKTKKKTTEKRSSFLPFTSRVQEYAQKDWKNSCRIALVAAHRAR
uniref:Uncharacterized protein n=1 Tax=Salix viminalis TaxID=40686 RepID=A0A6N2L205_SALVM